MPARGEKFTFSTTSSRSVRNAQLEHQPIVDAPAILREHRELGAADVGVRQWRQRTSFARQASRRGGRTSTCWL